MGLAMNYRFTVHFSALYSTTRTLELHSEKTELYSLADLATLGFAIPLMTSASVALADCFFVFLLPISDDFTSPGGVYGSI